MKHNSLLYNNCLLKPDDFINSILSLDPKQELPTCKIEETSDFYYININSFYDDKHILEISYKYNFLMLKISLNNNVNKFLFQKIFYLSKIDTNNILLHDYKNSIELIIPKIS